MRKQNSSVTESFSPLNVSSSPNGFGHIPTIPELLDRTTPINVPKSPKSLSVTALASLRDDQTQTQTPRSWSQYFSDKLSFFPYVARTYNVIFYALVVTCVFVLLAIQRANGQNDWAFTYGASSAIFNYPMAIAFND